MHSDAYHEEFRELLPGFPDRQYQYLSAAQRAVAAYASLSWSLYIQAEDTQSSHVRPSLRSGVFHVDVLHRGASVDDKQNTVSFSGRICTNMT